jgi:Protein of unknown function (DUF2855)
MHTLVVDQAHLTKAKWVEETSAPCISGSVRLRVDVFALTANNMTYAAFGKAMRYWDFYPREDGGVVPVWGFAQVVESQHDTVTAGQRFYGYYPMASEVLLTPSHASDRGFSVASGLRADLASVYNQYVNVASDPFYQVDTETLQAVMRPLFATSWLLADFFQDNAFFGAEVIVCSSASSKTAFAMAQIMKRSGQCHIVGLTSKANVAFCESLGCYDQVLTYEQIDTLPTNLKIVYVDFAGNAALRRHIHERFPLLSYSCSVGGTHHDALGGGSGLAGVRPILFFAPAQMKKRQTDWGAGVFGKKLVDDWLEFVKRLAQSGNHPNASNQAWVQIAHGHSQPAILAAWQQLASGASAQDSPRVGKVFSF